MEDDFEFDLDAELLQEQQLREEMEMEMDMRYLEQQQHAEEEDGHGMMVAETDPAFTVRGGHLADLEEGNEPEASGATMRTPLRPSPAKKPRLESPLERSPAYHVDMASNEKMRARTQLFSHSVELATEREGVLRIGCPDQLHSKPLLGENCLTTVLPDGSRYFIKMRTDEEEMCARDAAAAEQKSKLGLLSQSMRELMKEADRLRIDAITKSKKKPSSTFDTQSKEQHLWVEKYAPKSFSQLLSSEQINREVLRGLKQWDAYVFGTHAASADTSKPKNSSGDSRPPVRAILLSGPAGTGKTTLAHVAARHCGYRPMELNASDDRSADALKEMIGRACNGNSISGDKRPNCIILDEIDGIDGRGSIDALINIIKAPLGTGKGKKASSALALTRPLICICNDLYSPQLRELRKYAQVFQFSNPTEARLIQRLKAVCVAEGIQVSSGALNMLCAATGHDIRSSINTLQFAAMRSSQIAAQHGANPASRDIGGVLASMIASGLKDSDKDIFQIWKEIFNFKEAAKSYTKKNIYNPSTLVDSGDSSTNDSSYKESQSVGRASRSVPSIDVSLLQSIRASVDGSSLGSKSQDSSKGGHAFDIMQAAANYGDNQSVLIGVFENYLNMRYHDPSMSRTSSAADWLCVSDIFSGDGSGHFTTDIYAPLGASAIHVLCASDSRANIAWPKKDANMKFLWNQRLSIVQTLIESACSSTSQAMRQNKSVVLDVIPYLVDLISPAVRSVGYASLSSKELDRVRVAARVMASCGVKYEYQTSVLTSLLMSGGGADSSKGDEEGGEGASTEPAKIVDASLISSEAAQDQSLFRLEPPVTELLSYSKIPELMNRRPTIGPELKNVLYVETQKAILSAKNDAVAPSEVIASTPTSAAVPAAPLSTSTETVPPPSVPTTTAPRKSGFDFFSKAPAASGKRQASSTTPSSSGPAAATSKDGSKSAIRFKFSQGFSAAVKRPVNISEFL